MKLIQEKIKAFDTIIIHGHKHPDGDCYGAQFGLKNMLQNTFPQKKVYAVGETNDNLSFLGLIDQIDNSLYQNALVIVVDSGEKESISDPRFSLGKFIIRIDHHILIQNYGDYQWVDASFASCSEMIFLLKERLNLQLTFKGALAIFIGIVTDTGNFRYNRVNSQTFLIVSELMKYGIDITLVEKAIKKEKLSLLKYKGYVCQHTVAVKNLVYVSVSQKIMKQFGLTFEETFVAMDILANLEYHPFYVLFVEKNNQEIQVRICSNGPQIYDIVKKYGGKGHLRACTLFLPSVSDILPFINDLQKEIALFLKQHQVY
ncbi:DHH family phosphoesterase [Candidatus Phytoplasma meliae]|uniref:Bifunctional oligoribonuclease/PAP phosphatase NrnA n=1 Tax=Candidatus Phytoplasma meliae TaxID=1848402 RepID=A0ABS5CYN5_9MOLU|nr:bifunctional oligoribonuclease/PAP phosphatase NrnA [Candidatus Phytoplasma meliae]MBP5836085.1 bifunctional oligoribonuclease/PAP phosphatase NrnA [Candidatus Phytoplasma meliae]